MSLRIALHQSNPEPGDPLANAAAIRAARAEAAAAGAAVLLTPQFSLCGGPPGDLAGQDAFRAACAAAAAALAAETADGGPALAVGLPWEEGGRLLDGVWVLEGGRVAARRARHGIGRAEPFDPGPSPGPVALRGARLGLAVGADALDPAIAETLAETGAELLVGLAALPFAPGAAARRVGRAVARVVETGLGLVLLNRIGGQDGLVCDGGSVALNPDRSLALQLPGCEAALALTDWSRGEDGLECAPLPLAPEPGPAAALWAALRLAVEDHAARSGAGGIAPEPGATLLAGLAAEVDPARLTPGGPPLRLGAADRVALLEGRAAPGAAFLPFAELTPTALGALCAARGLPAPAADPARDAVLDALLDAGQGLDALRAAGHEPAALAAAWRLLCAAARRTAPPGVRLGGRGLRLPATHAFTDPFG